MATEVIIMKLVALGVSRQDAHEEIRVLSHQASDVVKNQGGQNDLIERIRKTEFFAPILSELDNLLKPENFIGRCEDQVQRFVDNDVKTALAPYQEAILSAKAVELTV